MLVEWLDAGNRKDAVSVVYCFVTSHPKRRGLQQQQSFTRQLGGAWEDSLFLLRVAQRRG